MGPRTTSMKLYLLLSLTLIHGCAAFTCPTGCRCKGYKERDEGTLECKDVNIYSVMCLPLHSTKYLRITNSRGHLIKESMFAEFLSLRTLILADNNIQGIEPKAFNNLQNLHLLDLSRNNISEIIQGNFIGANNVVTLILSGNKIKSIYPGIFDILVKLYDLQLDNNDIQEVQCDTFKGMTFLDNLDLTRNSLEYLPSCVFEGLKSLQVLRLSKNKLKFLSAELFKPMINLKALHMSGNYLEVLPTFEGLGQLQVLNLADNDLPIVPTAGIENMRSLHTLTLSGNPIAKIHNKDFRSLKNLVTMHLNRMRSLSEIEPGTFDELKKLEIITLQEHSSDLEIPTSAVISRVPKYFINGKEIVETENIPTQTDLQKQFAQLSPDGAAIAPNVKIIDIDRPSHQGSFSEQMKELIDFYHQKNKKGTQGTDNVIPEEEMSSKDQEKFHETRYNSFASSFNQLSPNMELDHLSNSETSKYGTNMNHKGLLAGVIISICCVSLVVTGIIYRGRRRRSKFIGYTPVSREDMETVNLLSNQSKVVPSYGT